MSTKSLTGIYSTTYDLHSPVTTLSITASGYLALGITSTGLGSYAIINGGVVQGDTIGIGLAGSGTITNKNEIRSRSTTTGVGIILGNGGSVSNGLNGYTSALIEGYFGIEVGGQAGTVTNAGSIIGTGKYGVALAAGGSVKNGGGGATKAIIEGEIAIIGVLATTVHNYGTILGAGTLSAGAYLKAGGLVTNGDNSNTTATIEGGAIALEITGAAGTVINNGSIVTTGTAVAGVILGDGGSVTNGSVTNTHALISGGLAVAIIGQAGTVTNFGTIRGQANGGAINAGVYSKAGGVITNGGTADTTALIDGPYAVAMEGLPGTVRNFGTIGSAAAKVGVILAVGGSVTNGSATDTTALVQGSVGVITQVTAGTVHNYGTILAGGISLINSGVVMAAGGSVFNGSASDTTAFIQGQAGVYAGVAPTTVANFGYIYGTQVGVGLGAGGKITNGSNTDTTAVIKGQIGAEVLGAAGTIANYGAIHGGVLAGFGAALAAGGVFTNGGVADTTATITGLVGVAMIGGAKGTNYGTIAGNSGSTSVGLSLGSASLLTNGSATDTTALITGHYGALVGSDSTLTNFGTVRGTGSTNISVALGDATALLIAEAGSTFVGLIDGGMGVVDVVGGVATASGLISASVVKGAGTLSLSGGVSTLETGVALNVAQIAVSGGATVVNSTATNLVDGRIWNQTGGTLSVASGDKLTFSGAADTFSGTVAGLGTVAFTAGKDLFTGLMFIAAHTIINGAQATLAGTINNIGGVTVTADTASTHLIVDAGGATLVGAGTLNLTNFAANVVTGATAAATLTNVNDKILGAGHLGNGQMTLVNQVGGVINGNASNALIIDTGANIIVNAGLIEAVGAGGVTIASAIANTGSLFAAGGKLTVNGAVTGAGVVKINGATADFNGAFGENVTFTSTTGVLELAHSQAYAGKVTGLSHAGTSSLDLLDISYAGGTTLASYVDNGSKTGGVLTVTDGTHTAHITLVGDYSAAVFNTSSDGHGGTTVVDPVKAAATSSPSTALFVAHMAALETHAAASHPTPHGAPALMLHLAAPRCHA